MHFRRLLLTDFRNYPAMEIDFCPGVNILTGNNGEGKTNVLEAIHYLAMTRGFQAQGEKYSLLEGAPYFTVEGHLESEEGPLKIQCSYQPPRGKRMLVNGNPLSKMSDHMGVIPLVAVLPGDTQLITEGPALRRKFMDSFISQHDPNYLENLIRYEKALVQRNALLAHFSETGNWDRDQLELWEIQMTGSGKIISEARQNFIRELGPAFTEWFSKLVSDKETPTFEYESMLVENSNDEWAGLFRKSLDRDKYSLRTSTGIHKDDLIFKVNGQPVKDFGSQGQQKTYVLALRFAQYELLETKKEGAPILLLDDIFDKLDFHRLSAIASLLEKKVKGQVFVTDTSADRSLQIFGKIELRKNKFFDVYKANISELKAHGKEK